MAFCGKCGSKLTPGSSFCPNCGAKAAVPHSGNTPVQAPTPVREIYAGARPKKKRSPGLTALIITLSVTLAAEGVVAGIWFPGFFNPGDSSGGGGDDTSAVFNMGTEDIPLRYSDSDVENAEPLTAKVSEDNPTAEFGGVKVELKSWNLENEDDTLTVRELKELDGGDDGWCIKAYDFSLESGQREFDTSVKITIPCDDDPGDIVSCVSFNEEEDRWEDLYSEKSADGKSYILYTNHFSKKGVKKLKYVYRDGALKENDTGETVDLDSGVFKERTDRLKKGQSRMEASVWYDRKILWDMYALKTVDDAKEIGETLNYFVKYDEAVLRQKMEADNAAAGGFIGTAGALDNLNTLLKNAGYKAPYVSYVLTAADLALTMMRVHSDALENKRPYWEALNESMIKNDKVITESVVSASATIGVGATYGGLAGAVAGLAVWGAFRLADKFTTPTTWYNTTTPEWKDMYNRFYYSGAKVDCGSEEAKAAASAGNGAYAVMKKPASMKKEKWETLSASINKKPLIITYNKSKGTFKYKNFSNAYKELIKLYANDPANLEKVLDEFFQSYANAFWNMSDKAMTNYVKKQCSKLEDNDYFEEEFLLAGDISRPDKLLPEDAAEIKTNFIASVKSGTAEIMMDALDDAVYESYKKVEKGMDELCRLLNKKIEFRVVDRSLQEGESFEKSIYYTDWQEIKENEEYLPKNNKSGGGYDDDPEFITPMRFAFEDALFKPMGPKRENIPYTEYHPYRDTFTPRVDKSKKTDKDVVYTCTLYHYLMMGSPKQMIFRDARDPEKYAEEEKVYADIVLPEFDEKTSTIEAKVIVEGDNDIAELEGNWGAPSDGTQYANKERGSSMTLTVSDGGNQCNFTSSMKGEDNKWFNRDGKDSAVNFVYHKSTGKLAIWNTKSGSSQTLTLERISERIIRVKEYNYYLERKDAGDLKPFLGTWSGERTRLPYAQWVHEKEVETITAKLWLNEKGELEAEIGADSYTGYNALAPQQPGKTSGYTLVGNTLKIRPAKGVKGYEQFGGTYDYMLKANGGSMTLTSIEVHWIEDEYRGELYECSCTLSKVSDSAK